jgi:imidazole glycerol-phosphate synthase subunit HisH
MIAIFDYGAGNLQSVRNTLDAIGAKYEVTRSSDGLRRASKIILPGVGHFGQTMRALDELCVRDTLLERIHAGVPFFGICLGLQALFSASEEAPEEEGLGVFEGTVARFRGNLRIPHMGWDQIEPGKPSRLLKGLAFPGKSSAPYFYFAHSYYCPVVPETAATCDYMTPYTAVLEQDNIFGVQFHPEKSGALGQVVVRNFVEL